MNAQHLFVLLCTYLLGSLPSAYIVTHVTTGKDIRNLGNGNAGAKNTFESVGKVAGISVFLLDIAKGALAIALARFITQNEDVILIAGACAVFGHDFPLFLRFKGGQGMATTVGVFGALFPLETGLGFAAFALVLAITRHWDYSCLVGFVFLVATMWITGQSLKRVIYTVIILPIIGLNKLLQVWQAQYAIQQDYF